MYDFYVDIKDDVVSLLDININIIRVGCIMQYG